MREKINHFNKEKPKILIFRSLFFVFGLFLISFVNSQSFSSSYSVSSFSSSQYMSSQGVDIFTPSLTDNCESGQDFILQISPLGCQPTVVRSDLLEDSNVPIFCPLLATKINPLIGVDSISSINVNFEGKKPAEVSSVGFHPSRAAVKSSSRTILNSPILDNVGYAVIVLKRMPNESSMPENVKGTLTAKIRYDIKAAFGIGENYFYLPVIDDNKWKNEYQNYGFWNGKGYLKAESVSANEAQVAIYTSPNDKYRTFNLQKGKSSSEIILPGMNCHANFRLSLIDTVNPGTTARILVNGEITDVAEGESFLDNKCTLKKGSIENIGLVKRVVLNCRQDDKSGNIVLIQTPKVIIRVNNEEKNYAVGEKVYTDNEGKGVYIAGVFQKKNTNELAVWLVKSSSNKDSLTISEVLNFADKINIYELNGKFGSDDMGDLTNKLDSFGMNVKQFIVGTGDSNIGLSSPIRIVQGKEVEDDNNKITLIDFGSSEDKQFLDEYQSEFEESFSKALESFETIVNNYPDEDIHGQLSGLPNLVGGLDAFTHNSKMGELSLAQEIKTSSDLGQKQKMKELCSEFSEKYSKSGLSNAVEKFCSNSYINSNPDNTATDVIINNQIYSLQLASVNEPGFDDFGAKVTIQGKDNVEVKELVHSQNSYLEDGSFVVLNSLTEESAGITISVKDNDGDFNSRTLNIGLGESKSYGAYTIKLDKINLNRVAKVKIELPGMDNAVTVANFTFNIGIEKRAIQLTPDELKNKIAAIEKQIAQWQKVSDGMGKLVKGLKAACVGTATVFTIKNLLENKDGKAVAREDVMRGKNGWIERCKEEIKSSRKTLDACLFQHRAEINSDVDKAARIIEQQNNQIANLKKSNTNSKGVVNDARILEDYSKHVANSIKDASYTSDGKKITINQNSDIYKALNEKDSSGNSYVSLEKAREIEMYAKLQKDSAEDSQLRKIADEKLSTLLNEVEVNYKNNKEEASFLSDLKANTSTYSGINGMSVFRDDDTFSGVYHGAKTDGKPMEPVSYNGEEYILILKSVDGKVYSVEEVRGKNNHKIENPNEKLKAATFQKYDSSSYKNQYKDPEVRYYETGVYAGLPAIVPLGEKLGRQEGWYAATKPVLSMNEIKAFDESGKVASFWLCNVGKNGVEEFNNGIGDDICEQINRNTGQPMDQFPGLSSDKAKQMTTSAITALEQASERHQKGMTSVKILDGQFKVGKPAANVPDVKCQDLMSPTECAIIFNVCDPVICPSSRCDLGGTYPVDDVIQSGIIGSAVLCAPNFIGSGGDVAIPVCLTGIQAGIDGFVSILKNGRDCLKEQLETGKNIGICDEIQSIYMCEFFWKQAVPAVKYFLPKILSYGLGQGGTRGGGEYIGFQSAWDNAQKSVNYFTQSYAANSYKAFKARTTDEVGSTICKNFISARYPASSAFFDALIEPDSPEQYHAWFSETQFTTATSPATSQYKVFYHIYSGKDQGVYYKVYLREPTGSSYYQGLSETYVVANGYSPRGEYKSETKDFVAPSGYKDLCISINAQEHCGFKQVTTSFALNYVNDMYMKQQATAKVTTEAECISGTSSVYSLLQPNLQAGVEETIKPSIYNRGIIRVCATENPGKGTDANYNNPNSARWRSIGTCGSSGIICWEDTESVKNAIKGLNIEKDALSQISSQYALDILNGQYQSITPEDFDAELSSLISDGIKPENYNDKDKLKDGISKIDELISKTIMNEQKAALFFLKGIAYGQIASIVKAENSAEEDKRRAEELAQQQAQEGTDGETPEIEENECRGLNKENCDAKSNVCEWTTDIDLITRFLNIITFDWGENNGACIKKTEIEIPERPAGATLSSAQIDVGNRLYSIAEEIGKEHKISDNKVKSETGVKNFPCLVLMLAMQESSMAQCNQGTNNNNPYEDGNKPLYCETQSNDATTLKNAGVRNKFDPNSFGVMQINLRAHNDAFKKDESMGVFEDNAKYGVTYLINQYNSCKKNWKGGLASYNQGSGCNENLDYVTKVLGHQATIEKNFPACNQGEVSSGQVNKKEIFPVSSNGKATIVIDAGHGGNDNGAVYITSKTPPTTYNEDEINLAIALKLREKLKNDYNIFMVREGDNSVNRGSLITDYNNNEYNLYVSIHANSVAESSLKGDKSCDATGTETYYWSEDVNGKDLAVEIANKISSAIRTNNRGAKEDSQSQYKGGLYVLRNTKMPAVLIETGFVCNNEDVKKLTTQRDNIANAIAEAIDDNKNKFISGGSATTTPTTGIDSLKEDSKYTILLYDLTNNKELFHTGYLDKRIYWASVAKVMIASKFLFYLDKKYNSDNAKIRGDRLYSNISELIIESNNDEWTYLRNYAVGGKKIDALIANYQDKPVIFNLNWGVTAGNGNYASTKIVNNFFQGLYNDYSYNKNYAELMMDLLSNVKTGDNRIREGIPSDSGAIVYSKTGTWFDVSQFSKSTIDAGIIKNNDKWYILIIHYADAGNNENDNAEYERKIADATKILYETYMRDG